MVNGSVDPLSNIFTRDFAQDYFDDATSTVTKPYTLYLSLSVTTKNQVPIIVKASRDIMTTLPPLYRKLVLHVYLVIQWRIARPFRLKLIPWSSTHYLMQTLTVYLRCSSTLLNRVGGSRTIYLGSRSFAWGVLS